jgi:hypothetical protein
MECSQELFKSQDYFHCTHDFIEEECFQSIFPNISADNDDESVTTESTAKSSATFVDSLTEQHWIYGESFNASNDSTSNESESVDERDGSQESGEETEYEDEDAEADDEDAEADDEDAEADDEDAEADDEAEEDSDSSEDASWLDSSEDASCLDLDESCMSACSTPIHIPKVYT